MEFRIEYSDLSVLPTRAYFAPLDKGDEILIEIERGKTLIVQLTTVGELDKGVREVFFSLNGRLRTVRVRDREASREVVVRERANAADPCSVGAPMPGVVVELHTTVGAKVELGAALVVLSAMKMETVVASPVTGTVGRLAVVAGDDIKAGDLLCELESEPLQGAT
jgi:pyruvate carboxylase